MTALLSRPFKKEDLPFFTGLAEASPEWKKEECQTDNIESYMLSYSMYGGEWEVWLIDSEEVAVSYVLEWSPSNGKPWLGTLIVHPDYRNRGIGTKIINLMVEKLNSKGNSAIFAGCPINQDSWLQFLGKCGFEQFKVEKDDRNLKEYMITVKPTSLKSD